MAQPRYFEVRGKVQNVMFRQTVIRGLLKRQLVGGATNDAKDKALVRMTLAGDAAAVDAFVAALRGGKPINDWGARATKLTEVSQGTPFHEHQVTTDNVDSKKWNPNVKMYL